MNAPLLILSGSAFGLVALLSSLVASLLLPSLDRLAALLAPRHRVRLWLGIAALPLIVATLGLFIAFLPALGLCVDHCLSHGAHPHLCPNHANALPGSALIVLAALLAGRVLLLLLTLLRTSWLSWKTSETLASGSQRHGPLFVFSSPEPQAFVLGVFRVRIFVSSALMDLPSQIREPALAHEHAHVDHRDSLWRALAPLLACAHIPGLGPSILARLQMAQEMAADESAAAALQGDRLRVADALVQFSRFVRPSPGLAFGASGMIERIQALLRPLGSRPAWPLPLVAATCLMALATAAVLHEPVHHGIESLLGTLG